MSRVCPGITSAPVAAAVICAVRRCCPAQAADTLPPFLLAHQYWEHCSSPDELHRKARSAAEDIAASESS
jgi:hypothetical protein